MKKLLLLPLALLLFATVNSQQDAAPAAKPAAKPQPKAEGYISPYLTNDKNASPITIKDIKDINLLMEKQGKAEKYKASLLNIDKTNAIFWLYPKTWKESKTEKGFAYETPNNIPEVLLGDLVTNKIEFLDELAQTGNILSEGAVNIDGRLMTLYRYVDKDDEASAIDCYMYDYNGYTLAFTVMTSAQHKEKADQLAAEVIKSIGMAKLPQETTAQAAVKDGISDVQISEPDVKNMQAIKFPVDTKFFYTLAPASLDANFRGNRIYFNCGEGEKCASLIFLQKFDGSIKKEAHEAALSKRFGNETRKAISKNENIGRFRVQSTRKEYKTKVMTNYYFTNGQGFVLTSIAEPKDERKMNAFAHGLIENTRLLNK